MPRRRTTFVLLLLLGCTAGAASVRWRVPPYPWLADLGHRLPRYGSLPSDPARSPSPPPPATSEALDALAYVQAGRAAGPSGTRVRSPDKMAPGLTLLSSADEPAAELIDSEGRVRHRWALATAAVFPQVNLGDARESVLGRFWRRVRLLPDGGLIVVLEDVGAFQIDRDSRIAWSALNNAHHAFDIAPDGTIYMLTARDRVVVSSEPGGAWPSHAVREDRIAHLSADGKGLGSVSILDALRRSSFSWLLDEARELASTEDTKRSRDLLHANELQVLAGDHGTRPPAFADGHLLVSLRNVDALVALDVSRERVVWAMRGPWHRQHAGKLVPNGRLLVFDNLGFSKSSPRSRALEVDPASGEIAWSWPATAAQSFFTETCGSALRLDNGNTLLTESLAGRAVEVTPAGEIVWEYVSPHRMRGQVAVLLEAQRIAPSRTAWLDRGP
jgi:hypothetical protein